MLSGGDSSQRGHQGGKGGTQLCVKFGAVKLVNILHCKGARRRILPVLTSLISFILHFCVEKRVERVVKIRHFGEVIESTSRSVLENAPPVKCLINFKS